MRNKRRKHTHNLNIEIPHSGDIICVEMNDENDTYEDVFQRTLMKITGEMSFIENPLCDNIIRELYMYGYSAELHEHVERQMELEMVKDRDTVIELQDRDTVIELQEEWERGMESEGFSLPAALIGMAYVAALWGAIICLI